MIPTDAIRRFLILVAAVFCVVWLSACGGSPQGQPDSDFGKSQSKAGDGPQYELAESHRTYLWSLEHHNNILTQVGFAKLGEAIKTGDKQKIEQQFGPKFKAHLRKDSTRFDLVEGQGLAAHRIEWSGDNRPEQVVSGQQFAESLARDRQQLAKDFHIGFAVTSIAPRVRSEPTGLWDADCRIRQWGQTSSGEYMEVITTALLTMQQPDKTRMSQNGWLLGWTTTSSTVSRSKQMLMKDVAQQVGIDVASLHDNWRDPVKVQGTGGIYACDFNQDGCTDLLVSDITGNKMYQGGADGKFQDVTLKLGLVLASNDVRPVFVDLNGDGWQDLVLGDGTIFRNVQGKEFRQQLKSNLSRLIKIPTLDSSITGISTADFDRDGHLDLYLIRNGTRPKSWLTETSNSENNQLLRNLGNWRFEDVTASAGVGGGRRSVFAVVWLDANNDRWPDFFIINEYGNGGLYVNNQDKTFTEKKLIDGPGDFGSMGVTAGDVNNDGRIDIFLASMYSKAGSRVIRNIPKGVYPPEVMARLKRFVTGSELYLNHGKQKFAPSGRKFQIHDAGWAWGPALVDLNGDGWLDVFSTAGYMSRDRTKPDG